MSRPASRQAGSERTRDHARELRRNLTPAEAALWGLPRDRRLSKLKWRRQTPIGHYIVDFVCLQHRLIVECDGSQHADSPSDVVRDAWFASQGFRVLRFWNNDVLNRREATIATILSRCGLPF